MLTVEFFDLLQILKYAADLLSRVVNEENPKLSTSIERYKLVSSPILFKKINVTL